MFFFFYFLYLCPLLAQRKTEDQRCFFAPLHRITGSSITIDEARDYELSQVPPPTTTTTTATVNSPAVDEEKNSVMTFSELKELIESGNVDKIPNNKIIPEALNVRICSAFTQKSFFFFCTYLFIHIGCTSKSIDRTYKKETLGDIITITFYYLWRESNYY